MTKPKPHQRPVEDFEGHTVTIGDNVVYTHIIDTHRRGLRRGIIIEIIPNFNTPMYHVFDINDGKINTTLVGRNEIMYDGSDYRGLDPEYILSLFNVDKEEIAKFYATGVH